MAGFRSLFLASPGGISVAPLAPLPGIIGFISNVYVRLRVSDFLPDPRPSRAEVRQSGWACPLQGTRLRLPVSDPGPVHAGVLFLALLIA